MRLHGKFQPGLNSEYESGNMGKMRGNYKSNMANAKIRKILSLVFVQFGLLMAMTLQLYGMIIAYKLLETKRIMLLSTYLSTKRFTRRN